MKKEVLILGFVSFFTDMASAMITTTFPLFLVYVLKNGVDKLGFVIGIATFVSYFFRVIFGILSDKYGVRKPLALTGYIISAVSKPLFYFATSWQHVAVFRSLDRFAKAMRSAPKDALLSAYGKEKGKIFGIHKMLDVAGEMSGALIVFLMFYVYSANEETFRNIFLMTVFPGFMAIILSFFIKDVKTKRDYKFDLQKDKDFVKQLLISNLILLFVISESYFLIKAKESFEFIYIPLFVVLMNATETLFSYPFGLLIEKLNEKFYYFLIVFHILAVITLYFGFVTGAFMFEGLFLVGFFNYFRIMISKKAYNTATVYGVFYFIVAVLGGIGSIITGIIWKRFGFDTAVCFTVFGMLLSLLLWRAYVRTDN
ncbi:putative permeases of the major facilitator superfamily [Nautilia profundicola AmH]|uniref:Permeases of the major facilitator superfamily n=1 Tax=Nautilia profundicola (strain ATCC BAA-1463 / DSM 18972 / AmH) TaxID=598659 RepID=B9L974_NAUPA|nr:MFS transporter [Nautilia profundicola]ACM93570.1 putative permeases of the major facilitator superfamily [Nautilia profundicola AmH]